MGLQKIVILCVALVLVAGGAWYVFQKNGSSKNESTNTDEEQMEAASEQAVDTRTEGTEDETLTGTGSMFDLLALGRSIRCTYSYSDDISKGSGTAYFDNGHMRVDADYVQDNETFETHVINDGSSLYTWTITNEGTQAFKMPAAQAEADYTNDNISETGEAHMETINENVSYECNPWRVDQSLFVPPAGIDFMDMEAMMQGVMENFEGMEGVTIPQ